MNNFIELLKKQSIGRNTAITGVKLAMANVKLKQSSFPSLPIDFEKLLQNFNGLSNEGSLIFGAEIESTFFVDLVKFNKKFFHDKPSKWIILGYDDVYYMIFDSIDKKYNIVDRDTFEPSISSESPKEPISFLLRIES